LSAFGDNKRIYLDEITVALSEAVVDMLEQEDDLALVLGNPQVVCRLQEVLNLGALIQVDGDLEDLLGVAVSDVLNGHTASR
jgi:hypothetical protein